MGDTRAPSTRRTIDLTDRGRSRQGVEQRARDAAGDASGAAREAAQSTPVRWAGRLGLAARGLIYVLIGVLALQIAFGHSGNQADQQGALRRIAGTTGGLVVLWALVVGFVGLALWRLSHAVWGAPEPDGRSKGARAKNVWRAGVYAVLAVSVLRFVTTGHGKGSNQQSQQATAGVMAHGGGRWLVAVIGVVVVVAAALLAWESVQRKFLEHLAVERMSEGVRRAVELLGVVGGVARAIVVALVGGFLVNAAWTYDPAKAKGLDGSLRSLAHASAGPWLLAAVALGLAAFGVFSFAESRYSR